MVEKKYSNCKFVGLMSLGTTMIMSFTAIIITEGTSSQLIQVWLNASALGFIIAFPTALIITTLARRAAEKFTSRD